MHVSWDDLELFLAVADTGSLTAAAQRLRITQPTASRRLQSLEASVGEALFVRGVQGSVLTAFGERMLEPARRMAEWAGEVERVAARAQTAPHGVVRLTAAPWVVHDFVVPFARQLRADAPELRLEVVSTVQYLDLARREADLALRMQPPTQRDLISVARFEFDVFAYASEDYVAKLPARVTPDRVDWIAWAPPFDHLAPNPQLAAMIPGFRPSFASDDYVVQVRAAIAGLGAIFQGRIRHRFSRPANLVVVPVELPPRRGSLHLVCARSALDVPRIKAVADRLVAEFAAFENADPPLRTRKRRGA